jgi:hypothetical protein
MKLVILRSFGGSECFVCLTGESFWEAILGIRLSGSLFGLFRHTNTYLWTNGT